MTRRRAKIRPATVSAALLCAVGGTLLASPAAQAADCSVSGSTLTFTLSGESGVLHVAGNKISIAGANCKGAPGVTEVSNIVVTGSARAETLTIDDAAQLAPGLGAEPGSVAEIEVAVDLGAGADTLRLTGGSGNDVYVGGTAGIDADTDDDADISYANVETLAFDGGSGDDLLSAQGDAGTGAAAVLPWSLVGGAGNDTLRGGTRNDLFVHEAGADTFYGGLGIDTIAYGTSTLPVAVTVGNRANDGPAGEADNVASDVEAVRGSAFADRLSGNAGRNFLYGMGGNDRVSGGGGADVLRGGAGNDALIGGIGSDALYGDSGADAFLTTDGVRDTLVGGLGVDRSHADRVDVRIGVERRY